VSGICDTIADYNTNDWGPSAWPTFHSWYKMAVDTWTQVSDLYIFKYVYDTFFRFVVDSANDMLPTVNTCVEDIIIEIVKSVMAPTQCKVIDAQFDEQLRKNIQTTAQWFCTLTFKFFMQFCSWTGELFILSWSIIVNMASGELWRVLARVGDIFLLQFMDKNVVYETRNQIGKHFAQATRRAAQGVPTKLSFKGAVQALMPKKRITIEEEISAQTERMTQQDNMLEERDAQIARLTSENERMRSFIFHRGVDVNKLLNRLLHSARKRAQSVPASSEISEPEDVFPLLDQDNNVFVSQQQHTEEEAQKKVQARREALRELQAMMS